MGKKVGRYKKLKACDPFNPKNLRPKKEVSDDLDLDEDKFNKMPAKLRQLMKKSEKLQKIDRERKQQMNQGLKPTKKEVIESMQQKERGNKPIKAPLPKSSQKKAKDSKEPQKVVSTKKPSKDEQIQQMKQAKMLPKENFYQYSQRIGDASREILQNHVVKIETNTSLKRKKFMIEKNEKKKRKKLGLNNNDDSSDEEKDFSNFKDTVRFGEVADQPPILSALPKRKKKSQPNEDDIIPMAVEKEAETFKRKIDDEAVRKKREEEKKKKEQQKQLTSEQLAEQKANEVMRQRVLKSYKEAKMRKLMKEPTFNTMPIG